MAPVAKTSKPIFRTSTPFTETRWPDVSQQDQEIILDLACNLITPIGDYRKTHIHSSKGKKRKRKSKEGGLQQPEAPPPAPEIGNHALVGINSVTRHLEALAAPNAPKSMPAADTLTENDDQADDNMQKNEKKETDMRPLSMVILTHPKPSASPAHAHFPTLIHLSTLHNPVNTIPPPAPQPRLIPLASSADARLASALHIPRVGALAIFADAPGAKSLEDFVRDNVDVTEAKWLDEAMEAEWRGVNVKTEMSVAKTSKKQHSKGGEKATISSKNTANNAAETQ